MSNEVKMRHYMMMDFIQDVETTETFTDSVLDTFSVIAWLWEDKNDQRYGFGLQTKMISNGKSSLKDHGMYKWEGGKKGMLKYLAKVRDHAFNKSPEKITECTIELRLLGSPSAFKVPAMKAFAEKLIEHDLAGHELTTEEVDQGIALKLPKRFRALVEETEKYIKS